MEILRNIVIIGLFVGLAALQAERIILCMRLRKIHRKRIKKIRERKRIHEIMAESYEIKMDIDKLFREKEILRNTDNKLPKTFYEGIVIGR